MADPFAAGLGALFGGPASVAADYFAGGAGAAVPIRVVHGQPDGQVEWGEQAIVAASNMFEIRRADVAQPAAGDVLALTAGRFVLTGEPRLDVEGLTWSCGAEPEPA